MPALSPGLVCALSVTSAIVFPTYKAHSEPVVGLQFSTLLGGTPSYPVGYPPTKSLPFAYSYSAYFDYRFGSIFSIGVEPQVANNVLKRPNADGAREVALDLRLRFGYPVHDRIYPYVLVRSGPAAFSEPSPYGGDGVGTIAFHLGAAAGLAVRLARGLSATIEAGYQKTWNIGFFLPDFGYAAVTWGLEYAF